MLGTSRIRRCPSAGRWRRSARGAGLALICALSSAPVVARAAKPPSLQVEVDGLDGDLKRSALAVMSIAAVPRDERLTETEIRRLHDRAPGEIKTALQVFGYYRPDVKSELTQGPVGWTARYRVTPGRPILLDSVSVMVTGDGADDPGFRRLVGEFPLREGDALDHLAYANGKRAFADAAAVSGYLDARFDVHEIRVNLDRYSAAIALEFDTGPIYRFGPVQFDQEFLDPHLLSGYVPFHRGDPLNVDRLLALQTRLSESAYFSRVEVQPRRDLAEGGEVPIQVELRPSKAKKYSAGLGYGTDTGIHARLGAELRRLNRRGHRAEAEARVSTIEKHVAGQYMIPWVHGRTDLVTVSSGYEDLRPETSHSRTAQVALGLIRSRGGWRETYSLTFRRERFDVGADAGVSVFLTGESNWSHVRADDRLFTRHGHLARLDLRASDRRILSDATFVRIDGLLKGIRSPGSRSRLIARFEAGFTYAPDFRDLPASLRFFAGGAQTVRGFAYQSLGPRDAEGRAVGGETLIAGSLEYEHRALEHWGAATFYDVGNAMRTISDPLEQGVGMGLRWLSPVGLVRLDAAVPAKDLNGRVRFHLTIGPDL